MALSTPQKWLVGCGIGCGAVIVLVIGLVTGAVFFVRGKIQPLQDASESRKQVVSAYGAPENFVPSANGAVAADRMEVFLAAREALKDAQTKMDAGFGNFDLDRLRQRDRSFGAVFRALTDLSNLVLPIGEYVGQRNRVLLEKRMGLGEYAYIYSITFHSWLGHRPNEGPPLLDKIREREQIDMSGNDPGFTPESVTRQYRRVILYLLRNQLDGIKDDAQGKWRETLRAEIDRIEGNLDRVAWQDGMPPLVEESLRPYRGRLAATYHPSSNYFELLTTDDFNQFQFNGRMQTGSESTRRNRPGPVEAPDPNPNSGNKEGIVYEVGAGVTTPVPTAQPEPNYTEEARKARMEGVLTLQAVIRRDGTVGSLRVLHGLGYGLDESAMDTISSQWKFKPGTLNGAPVEVRARIDVRFRLH